MTRTAAAVAAALVLAAAGLGIAGRAAAESGETGLPWVEINACGAGDRGPLMGIRAAMGSAEGAESLWMRFQVQWWSSADGAWRDVSVGGDSGWRQVAGADYASVEAGHTFGFEPPAAGTRYVMRGKVTFAWRRGGEVVALAERVTAFGGGLCLVRAAETGAVTAAAL